MHGRACIVIPAYQAERTLEGVVEGLRDALPELRDAIFVVNDGSTDGTPRVARKVGCTVIEHGTNRGKGAALATGFGNAYARGFAVALTVDADGQHPPEAARQVLDAPGPDAALVLGVRALERAGAPRKNQISNQISNFFISNFAHRLLRDTQCGLRRYPIETTLRLAARGTGYDFEAEILLRAIWAGVDICEVEVPVLYPEDRTTHFDTVRDPMRIVRTVVRALVDKRFSPSASAS
jgi:glycosyltransferase involved in cell wall biosynthesis